MNEPLDYLFISNPRAASVALNRELDWGQAFNHCPARQIRAFLGAERFDALFSFGLVRHPLDRLVSWYFYHRHYKGEYFNKHVYQGTFRDWVLSGCPHHWQATPQVADGWLANPLCQWEYFYDGATLLVDYVGRYEELETALRSIFARIQRTPKNVGRVNASRRDRAYRSYFDAETEKLAREMFARDFDLFGYV